MLLVKSNLQRECHTAEVLLHPFLIFYALLSIGLHPARSVPPHVPWHMHHHSPFITPQASQHMHHGTCVHHHSTCTMEHAPPWHNVMHVPWCTVAPSQNMHHSTPPQYTTITTAHHHHHSTPSSPKCVTTTPQHMLQQCACPTQFAACMGWAGSIKHIKLPPDPHAWQFRHHA